MKKTKRRLALDKQTIATLTPENLGVIAGGNAGPPDGGPCSTVNACVYTWTNPCTAYQCPSLVASYCGRC